MKVMFLESPYKGIVELRKKTIDFLKKENVKTVALFSSVQFVNKLQEVKDQLRKLDIKVISTKPKRAGVTNQLLGCNVDIDSLNFSPEELVEIDYFLYIGDGRFHPLSLVYAQKDQKIYKEILIDDPISKKFTWIDFEEIKNNITAYRNSLKKFLSSNVIGVIHSIKSGQQQISLGDKLERTYPDKKFYHFLDNSISFDQIENFTFIDTWVNTACPRIAFDEQEKFLKGIINFNDALNAKEILAKDSLMKND